MLKFLRIPPFKFSGIFLALLLSSLSSEWRSAPVSHNVAAEGMKYTFVKAASAAVTDVNDETPKINLTAEFTNVEPPTECSESRTACRMRVTATISGSQRYSTNTIVSVEIGKDGDSAKETVDYFNVGKKTITILAGEAQASAEVFSLKIKEDSDKEGRETISVTGTSAGFDVIGTIVTIKDDDIAGVTVTPLQLKINEVDDSATTSDETKATYTVVLDSKPIENHDVAVQITSDDPNIATVKPSRLTFSSTNWSKPKKVTVTAVDDDLDNPPNDQRSVTVSHKVVAEGEDYKSMEAESVEVTVIDNDKPKINLTAEFLNVDPPAKCPESKSFCRMRVTAAISGSQTYPTATPVSVTIGKEGDSAEVTKDYRKADPLPITIPANMVSGKNSFKLIMIQDEFIEGDERISVTGSSEGFDVIGTFVTIKDDDDLPAITASAAAVAEGASGATADLTFTFSLDRASSKAVSVGYAVDASSSTAVSGTDFETVTAGTVTFQAGTKDDQTVTVTVTGDDVDEENETVVLKLTNPQNATAQATVTGTITDDDTRGVTVSKASLTLAEVDDDGTPDASENQGTYTVVLDSEPVGGDVTVTVGEDSAVAGVDKKTLTFTASDWDAPQTVTVTAVNDDLDNVPDRTATLTHAVSGADYASVTAASVAVTVTDDEGEPAITASAPAVTEGASGATADLTFTFSLDRASSKAVIVGYAVDASSSTAVSGTDFETVTAGTVTFQAGTKDDQTVTVTVTGDDVDEENETVVLKLTNPQNATAQATVTGTITDDDTRGVTVSKASLTLAEVDDDGTPDASENQGTYTVVLDSEPVGGDVTVTVGEDSAVAGVDKKTLTFTASDWDAPQTVTVTAVNDDLDNVPDRTATLTHAVSGADYASVTAASVAVTVTDDDMPGVTVTPLQLKINEVDDSATTSDETKATYTVVLDLQPIENRDVTVQIKSDDFDIAAVTPRSLTFSSTNWNKPQTVTVTAVDDDIDNPPNDQRSVTISHNVLAVGGDYKFVKAEAVAVTVIDDDIPKINLTAITAEEDSPTECGELNVPKKPRAKPCQIKVTATISGTQRYPTATAVLVDIGAKTDSATLVDDYLRSRPSISITIPANMASASKTFNLFIQQDELQEGEEKISLTGKSTGFEVIGTFLIIRDQNYRFIPYAGQRNTYENSDWVSDTPRKPNWAIGDVTWSIDKGLDSIHFEIDAEDGTLSMEKKNFEKPEDFDKKNDYEVRVRIVDENGNSASTIVLVKVLNRDIGGFLSSPNPGEEFKIKEGDSAEIQLNFNVNTGFSDFFGTLEWTVVTGSEVKTAEGEALADESDYVANDKSGFALVFPSSGTITTVVRTVDDDIDENEEVFEIRFFSEENDDLVPPSKAFKVTITDDDTRGVTVSKASLTLAEVDDDGTPDASENQGTYTVVLDSEPVGGDVTVTVGEDSAVAGVDKKTLTFTASDWDAPQTVTVTAVNDDLDNVPDRTATLTHAVSGADYASVTAASVAVTVTDDEGEPAITASAPAVTEGASGATADLTFTFSLDRASSKAVIVGYAVDASSSTAVSGTDFETVTAGTVTFQAGTKDDQTVTVTVTGDDVDEENETVVLKLTNPQNATAQATVTGTITDDDTRGVTVSKASLTLAEVDDDGTPDASENQGTYTVVLDSEPVGGDVTVTVGEDSAVAGVDKKTLTFTASDWDAPQTVTVTAVNDDLDNVPDRTATLTHAVSGADYASVTAASVAVTVTDDEGEPAITASAPAVTEGASGATADLTFTFSLDRASSKAVIVGYAVDASSSTAVSGTDFETVTAGTVTFQAGTKDDQTVTVTVTGDDVDEENETVVLKLTNPQNATAQATVTGTITDDDTRGVTVSKASLTLAEVDDDGTPDASENQGTYTVVLDSEPVGGDVTVTVGEDSAVAGVDKKTLTFTASDWDAPQTVTVTAVNDDLDNVPDRTATLTHAVSGADYASVTAASVAVTVTDDEGEPAITASAPAVTEGASGATADLTFTFSLDRASSKAVIVGYAVDASSSTAVSGTDFETVTAGTVTFQAGTKDDQTVTVTVTGDDVDEENETVVLKLTNPQNATAQATVTGTITDDDTRGVTVSKASLTLAEVDDDGTPDASENQGTYTVVLDSEPVGGDVTVTVGEDSAVAGVDKKTLTFTASDWDAPQTVTVTAVNDDLDNVPDRTATLTHAVSGADYASVTAASVAVTVTDDEGEPAITASAPAVTEGASGATADLTFTFSLDRASSKAVIVGYAVDASSSTAVSGTDFETVTAGTVTFQAGTKDDQTVTVTVTGDDVDEENETVVLKLTNPQNATAQATVTGTITDDDTRGVTVSKASLTLAEVDDDGTPDASENQGTYTVVLDSEPVGGDVTVTVGEDSAVAGVDKKTLTFTASDWDAPQTVTVTAVNDDLDNVPDRTATLTHAVSGADYASVTAASVAVTVTDDEGEPAITASAPAVTEGASGATADLTFTFSLDRASSKAVIVGYAVDASSSTAVSGTDFETVTAGTVTFQAGTKDDQTVTVTVTGDDVDEENETVVLKLTNPQNATAQATVTGTITDDDTRGVTVSKASLTLAEVDDDGTPDASENQGTYTVVLDSEPVGGDVTVTVGEDSAVAGVDKKTLTFTASDWDAPQTVTVTAVNDDLDNVPDRTATLTHAVSGADYASVTAASVAVTVTDDEGEPAITASAPAVTEGASGATADLTFTFSLDRASSKAVIVGYAVDASSSTAVSGTDFETVTAGTVTFQAGTKDDQTVTVTVTGDDVDEENETVVLKLTNPQNATAQATVTGTITDDDTRGVTVSKASLTLAEVDDDGTPDASENQGTYTVVLDSEPVGGDVTVTVGEDSAVAGVDKKTLTFTASDWDAPQTVTVTAVNDDLDNVPDRTATLTHAVSGADYASVTAASVAVTVTDDEGEPAITASAPAVTEGASGATADLTFTFSLDRASSKAVIVGYAVDASSSTAVSGTDFETVTAGTVTFQAGTKDDQTVTVTVTGDDVDEENETVVLKLTNPQNATAQATVTGTITDDDTRGVTVSKASLTLAEVDDDGTPDASENQGTYTVVLDSEPVGGDVTVTVGEDSAVAGVDKKTLTFTASDWDAPQTVTVTAVNDDLDNVPDRTATLTHAVSGADYASVTAASVAVTVTDDEGEPAITASAPAVTEGASGATADLTFTFSLDRASSKAVIVGYAVDASSSTAVSGTDFETVTAGTVTFQAGTKDDQTVTVTVTGDDVDEENETVVLKLTNPQNATAQATVTGTITDDDTRGVTVSKASLTLAEVDDDGTPDASENQGTYTVVLDSEPVGGDVTVTVGEDSAVAGVDKKTLTFTASDWDAPQTVTVTAVNDDLDNVPDRTATLTHAVSGADYASVTAASVAVTVTDDEGEPAITASAPAVTEGASGATADLTFTFSLDRASSKAVIVGYAVDASSSTAVSGTDFETVTAGTVTFQAGTKDDQTVTVTVTGDDVDEENETVVLKLTNPQNATAQATVTGTITDDDTRGVTVSKASLTLAEVDDDGTPDASENQGTYTVVLDSEPVGGDVTVTVGEDSAVAGVDKKTLTFTASDWDAPQTVTVTAVNDDLDNVPDRTATLTHAVSGADYASVTAASVAVTVTDDEGEPAITASAPAVTEGASGATADLTFTFSLDRASSKAVIVGYAVDASSSTAVSGTDFETVTAGTVTFQAGTKDDQTVTVTVTGDDVDEENETVVLKLTNPQNATAQATVTGTITDDDTRGVTVSKASLTLAEVDDDGTPDASENQGTYTVVLDSEPVGGDVTVTVGEDSAVAGVDKKTLTFTASDWDAPQTVTVTAVNDDLDNVPDRTATLTHAVSGADYASVTAASVAVTVTDDEGEPAITASAPAVTEGASGATADLTFTFSLDRASSKAVIVGYAVDASSSTAVSGTDFETVTAGTVTFQAGTKDDQTVTVTVTGDDVDEENETVVLKLTNPQNATAQATVTGTITDDDARGDGARRR